MDISIIMPCYNETDNVSKIEREFLPVARELARTKSVEVVFVDDGSTDNTWQTLHDTFGNGENGPVVFKFERHPVNRGLGAALRTGFAAAQGQVIVTTDSDGTYRFSTIPALLACLTQRPDVDIVTASPYHPTGGVDGVPAYRLILSRGSSFIYRLLVNWRVHTYTALFRAYRRQVIDRVTFASDGYLAGTELLVKAMLAGYAVAEYPTVLYRRVYGVSKAKLIRTIRAHLGFQGSVLLQRLHLAQIGQPFPRASEGRRANP